MSSGNGRLYRHSPLPVLRSRASSWLPGVAANMAPLFTTGGASWPSVWPVAKLQTGCSRLTLAGVISPSGLYPQPSKVRRNISQLPSSGFFSRSALTGVYFRRISGIGPGTGVAEAGSIICCAEAPHMPAAAMAATHTLRMRTLVITFPRSEEHTSELQSRPHLVCRLLLEKKKEPYAKKSTTNVDPAH